MYTEEEKIKDFDFFKNINKDFFSQNGHKYLAIKNQSVVDSANDIPSLIQKMSEKAMDVGNYLIQECTGDNSAFTTIVMRLMIKGWKNA